MYILGLDISTSVIGVSIVNENGEIFVFDYLDLGKLDFWQKVREAEIYFKTLEYNISKIVIEKALLRHERTSAEVLSKIWRFNGIISYIVLKAFGVEPEYIYAQSIRKRVFGRAFIKGMPVKEYVMEEITKRVSSTLLEKLPRKQRGKNKGELANAAFDMADSLAAAWAGIKEII